MALGISLSFNTRRFMEKLVGAGGVRDQMQRRAHLAMTKVGLQMINDAIMEQPTVPILTGHLRASGSVLVDGEAKYTAEQLGHTSSGVPGTPAMEASEGKHSGKITTTVAFNTPYAARLHEHPEYTFSDPGAGGKFIEAKIAAHNAEYLKYVAAQIKAGM